MSIDKYQVIFTPSGKRGEFSKGTNVLDAARELGVDLDSVCGGRGICGRCQIIPGVGDFAKHGVKIEEDGYSEWSGAETDYVNSKGEMEDTRRLGCCMQIQGDSIFDVPEDSQIHKQVIRKDAEKIHIDIDSVISVYEIEKKSSIQDIVSLVESIHCNKISSYDENLVELLGNLSSNKINAVVRYDELIWLSEEDEKTFYGFAIDVGSTTVSCHLINLFNGDVVASVGAMNPQIRFGEDVMSRVSYAMMNKGGDREMSIALRNALSDLFGEAVKIANINKEQLIEIVVVGNPIMHHLFLGYDPTPLGFTPFDLFTDEAVTEKAVDIEIGDNINPNARVYVLPCIAGHVGADAASVALAVRPDQKDKRIMIADVGTNAEIIYGNKDKLFCCSSPTGPALEGAQIASGQRAAPGAIERVRIDRETFEPKFKVIGSDLWSNEEGFDEVEKTIGVTGICGSGIIEVIAEMFLAGLITVDGVVDGGMSAKTDRIVPNDKVFDYVLHRGKVNINVTQGDVRAIQLAKGALWAGCKILEDYYGEKCESVYLAGAFGSHIDIKYAMVLGLIPDCDLNMVRGVGNAAGTGARFALLNKQSRKDIEELVRNIEKIETALEPAFQQYFIDSMAIPNKTDPFVNLKKGLPHLVDMNLDYSGGGSSDQGGSSGKRERRRRR